MSNLKTYFLAQGWQDGWQVLDEFEAINDQEAEDYVKTVLCAPGGEYPDLDWYILDEKFENIFS